MTEDPGTVEPCAPPTQNWAPSDPTTHETNYSSESVGLGLVTC